MRASKKYYLSNCNNIILDLCHAAADKLGFNMTNVVDNLKLTHVGINNRFDLCIVILEGQNPRIHSLQYNLSKKIKSKKVLIFNENFTVVSPPKSWIIISLKRFIFEVFPLLFSSPKTFFADVLNGIKLLFRLKK